MVGIDLGLTGRPRRALSLNRIADRPPELGGLDGHGQEDSGPPARSTPRILALSWVFGSMAAILTVVRVSRLDRLPAPVHVSWWLLAVAFAVTEIFAINLDIRRQRHTFSLIELPLVIGLFFASPLGLVAAWVVGGGLALALYRRQSPLKLILNLTSFALEATTSVLCFRILLGNTRGVGPATWAPVFAAALLANLIGAACVTAAVEIGGGLVRWQSLLRLLITSVVAAPVANTSLALGATILLWSQPAAVWLLLTIAVILVFAYRGYAGLSGRYSNLQLLYEFTRAVEHSTERQTALQSLLASTRQLLQAEVAELLLVGEGEGLTVVHSELGPDDIVKTETYGSIDVAGPFWERAISSERGIRVPAKTRSKALRADLADHGRRDCMVVPLRRKGKVVGAMAVSDRWGDAATFKEDDLHFFEALANHAAVSLENLSLFNRLEHAAWHDELTGLANRASFNERITDALHDRAAGTKVAVLLMDLDRFKEVNDTLGHHQGDRVLVGVALRLGRVLRSRATLARLGGDEFAVLLTDLVDEQEPVRVAERLRRVLAEPFVLGDLSVAIGATVGIAVCPDHGDDASTLLQRADVAMYSAKGGDGVATYSTGNDNYSPRRLALVAELRAAIDHDQLELYYQPQADLGTGVVVGAEALLRWRHPLAGFVAPQEFVEVAERSDLMRPLTLFVLRSAIGQWRAWKNTNLDIAISVNLSVRNLVDPGLVGDLVELLRDSAMPASRLTLEITESIIMSDRTLTVVEELAAIGVRISIDDFGTGYSSLAYLKRLPVAEVKIDQSFVLNMESDENDQAIVHAVIDLATNLGLKVVAEGVETQAAWNMLTELGCPVAQGYLLSPPLPAPRFYAWVCERNDQRRIDGEIIKLVEYRAGDLV
jgi:diguanylate cyclase (GGDEF)-like protein